MIARPLPARAPEEIERLVRSLGSHRYVAGRLLLVHAFVFDALSDQGNEEGDPLALARSWAGAVLADATVDRGSRDERLWRSATEREVGAALAGFWNGDPRSDRARAKLASHLEAISAPIPAREAPLFDESAEDETFPILIDAGWELLPLAALDAEKHRGAIEAFGDRFAFECAKPERAESGIPTSPPLQELPAIGAHELLHGAEHGILRAPFVLWTEGSETYHDYVMRGVLRAAKLD
jgi:hypothetical protein